MPKRSKGETLFVLGLCCLMYYREIAAAMGLSDYKDEVQSAMKVEFHLLNFVYVDHFPLLILKFVRSWLVVSSFARDNGFNAEKCSVFFSLLNDQVIHLTGKLVLFLVFFGFILAKVLSICDSFWCLM